MVTESETKPVLTTGRRIWIVTTIVFSGLVLALAVAGIIGTWAFRGAVIDIGTSALVAIENLADAGQEAIGTIDGMISDVREVTGEVESAAGRVAQGVSDRGLLLTLLPPDKEQRLIDFANRIGETVTAIRSIIQAVSGLAEAIDSLPFVSLPGPDVERVQSLESDVQELRDSLEQLVAEIQAFRDGAAGEINRITEAAVRVNDRLDNTLSRLAQINSNLAAIQERAASLQQRLATIVTVVALIVTLFLAWVTFGMVALIRGYWLELRPAGQLATRPKLATALSVETPPVETPPVETPPSPTSEGQPGQ